MPHSIYPKGDFITDKVAQTSDNSANDIYASGQNIDEPGEEINPRLKIKEKILDVVNDIFNQARAVEDKSGINLHQRSTGRHFFPRSGQGVYSADADNRQATL